MGYLDENGLARYDGLIKNWVTFKSGTVDGVDPLLNWQKTATAGAVTCYPLPAAPIDPVVNFAFTETGPAEGTKAPDNPSTITGVSSVKVTRCGKNIIKFPYVDTTRTENGITWTVNDDGSITVSGTADGSSYFYLYFANQGQLKVGQTYTLSGCPAGGSSSGYRLRFGTDTSYNDTGNGVTFVASSSLAMLNLNIVVPSGTVISTPIVFKPQLELGSTATSFEPYEGSDYTIDLGGTYYGGSVDLSAGTMTVTRYGMVLDGTEAWYNFKESATAGIYRMQLTGLPEPQLNQSTHCIFTHYVYNGSDSAVGPHAVVYVGGALVLWDTYTTIDAFKAFLAEQYANGTPVKATYLLLNPYTVQLTPTQIYSLSQPDPYTPRVNTVYSDQVSVQVGYPKSPLATSTELTNAIISLGGNL